METYSICVGGDELRFSAAHFITLSDEQCEPIHGHDYGLTIRIAGPLGPHRYVFDFVALKQMAKQLIAELDHRLMLPGQHAQLAVRQNDDEVEVQFAHRRWLLPRTDCAILPLANTTAEELAGYLGSRLREELFALGAAFDAIELDFHEGPGYSARWTWRGENGDRHRNP